MRRDSFLYLGGVSGRRLTDPQLVQGAIGVDENGILVIDVLRNGSITFYIKVAQCNGIGFIYRHLNGERRCGRQPFFDVERSILHDILCKLNLRIFLFFFC